MGALEGRVCVVTGAGRGLGREHALLLAAEGARVVVNDLGGATDGTGADQGPANDVVDEIRAAGGVAIANTDSVTDWTGSRRMIRSAIEEFGQLHVLVNNAGIIRNRVLVHMTEDELDSVLAVHLKGHLAPAKWAAEYWRHEAKAGRLVDASIINTASGSMLGTPGFSSYGTAKAGIAAATLTMALELERYGVRANAIVPIARTRMAQHADHITAMVEAPSSAEGFDLHDPANVSPLVAYLASAGCPFTGGVFHVGGNEVGLFRGWSLRAEDLVVTEGRWSVDALVAEAPKLLEGRRQLASMMTSVEETYFEQRPLVSHA